MSDTEQSLTSVQEHDLLPPNATPLERGLSMSTVRLGEIPVEILNIWHPERCPPEFLPWLAWATSLDSWQEDWHEGLRRTLVSQSVPIQKAKGTRQAIDHAVRRTLALTIEPKRKSLEGIEQQLNGTYAIREWWEQEKGDPRRTPFSFEVRLLLGALLSKAAEGELGGKLYRDLRRAIDAVKPVTSRYTLTVGGLELKTQQEIGTMARAVHMARFTVTPVIPSSSPGDG